MAQDLDLYFRDCFIAGFGAFLIRTSPKRSRPRSFARSQSPIRVPHPESPNQPSYGLHHAGSPYNQSP